MRLQGKVALVTGAANARSIGWGIARALADEGADVVVNDAFMLDQLEARAGEIRALGRRGLAVPADVTKPEQVEAMFARAAAEMGESMSSSRTRESFAGSTSSTSRLKTSMMLSMSTSRAISTSATLPPVR